MELTLTGASLTSDGKGSINSSGSSAGISATGTNNNAVKIQQQAHSHSHVHDHGHSHGGKACCNNHGRAPSNFQSVEKIPKEKLISNPAVLFSAIVTSVKGGTFDTFKYLVDIVLQEEKEKEAPMNWGTDILSEDANANANAAINNSNRNTSTNNSSDSNNSGNDFGKKCISALGRKAQDGHTLVHWTAKRADDLRFIEYLAQQVTNINVNARSTDNVGMTPLHWAATEGSIPVVNFILKHLEEHSTGLSFSAHSTDTSSVKPSNHPINSRDKSGCTPLLIASQYGHADLAAFLIKHWADPNAVDDSRDTALHWAAYKGAVPVCGLLLHLNGIEDHLDTIDAFGQSPLHLASLRGNADVITYIIEQAEAFVDAQKKESKSNIGGGLASFPAKLLNMADREGKTPLDLAIKKKKGHAELLLRQYMGKYCVSDQSIWQKTVAAIRPFFSCKSWLSWIGITSENGRPPRFIFWFVAVNMALAFLYELVVYVPLYGSKEDGRLWDYMRLHYCTILSFITTIVTFIMVNQTDPGLLAKKNYASSNSSGVISMDTCMDASSMLCLDENKRIRREMHTLTNDLRNMYEETLESFASEHTDKAERLPLCHSCHISRPHRSKHCRVLNRCVLMFDHHCPFVGTTIGMYNYKYFYLFVFSFTITEILFGLTGILYLKRAPENAGFEVAKLLIGLYFSIYMLMTGGLSIYHTQLVKKNLTTNEHQNAFRYKYLKDENGVFRNPYDRGCLKNFVSRFFPGKDGNMLVTSNKVNANASSLSCNNSIHEGMDIEMRSASDKKNEEKLSLVQNVV